MGKNEILDIALSPDGTRLAIYANTGIYLYDTVTLGKIVFQKFDNPNYDENGAGAVAFEPGGNIIAISGKFADTPVDLWDISTGNFITSIVDVPPASGVTKIQFSPDGKSIFIRSFYGFTSRCEQADANFSLYLLDFPEPPKTTKIFSIDICQTIPIGFIRFSENNKFLLFAQIMGPQYRVTTVDIAPTGASQEIAYDNFDMLYDVSPNGEIYAFMNSQGNSRVTKLIDAKTSQVLDIIPYKVKLLEDDKHHFLIRDFLSTDGDWGLWKNGNVSCNFRGLTSKDLDFSKKGNIFATTTSEMDVIIWKISDCSIQKVLHFGN
jgi:WD40 repeat protein